MPLTFHYESLKLVVEQKKYGALSILSLLQQWSRINILFPKETGRRNPWGRNTLFDASYWQRSSRSFRLPIVWSQWMYSVVLENWDQGSGSPLFFPLLFCQVWQWKLHENKSGPIFFFPLISLVSHGNQSTLREKEGSESFLCLPMEPMAEVLLSSIAG